MQGYESLSLFLPCFTDIGARYRNTSHSVAGEIDEESNKRRTDEREKGWVYPCPAVAHCHTTSSACEGLEG